MYTNPTYIFLQELMGEWGALSYIRFENVMDYVAYFYWLQELMIEGGMDGTFAKEEPGA